MGIGVWCILDPVYHTVDRAPRVDMSEKAYVISMPAETPELVHILPSSTQRALGTHVALVPKLGGPLPRAFVGRGFAALAVPHVLS